MMTALFSLSLSMVTLALRPAAARILERPQVNENKYRTLHSVQPRLFSTISISERGIQQNILR